MYVACQRYIHSSQCLSSTRSELLSLVASQRPLDAMNSLCYLIWIDLSQELVLLIEAYWEGSANSPGCIFKDCERCVLSSLLTTLISGFTTITSYFRPWVWTYNFSRYSTCRSPFSNEVAITLQSVSTLGLQYSVSLNMSSSETCNVCVHYIYVSNIVKFVKFVNYYLHNSDI